MDWKGRLKELPEHVLHLNCIFSNHVCTCYEGEADLFLPLIQDSILVRITVSSARNVIQVQDKRSFISIKTTGKYNKPNGVLWSLIRFTIIISCMTSNDPNKALTTLNSKFPPSSPISNLLGILEYFITKIVGAIKGSLGAAVKLLPYDHEVMGLSPGNSLLQKCRERLRTKDPSSNPVQAGAACTVLPYF